MQAIVIVALALASSFGWVAWVRVSESDHATAYIDRDSISRDGLQRRFWELMDLKVADKDGDRSYRLFKEVDCAGRRYRYLAGSYFRRPMALGEKSGSFNKPTEWSQAEPGTTCEAIVRFVCADEPAPAHHRAGWH